MDDEDGIFWMVDGEKRPFAPSAPEPRLWLEESTEWRDPARPRDDKEPPKDEPSQLTWI